MPETLVHTVALHSVGGTIRSESQLSVSEFIHKFSLEKNTEKMGTSAMAFHVNVSISKIDYGL